MNPLCECPLAGYCGRHKVMKTSRQHELCRGVNCTPVQNAKYWDAWERGQMVGQTGPVENIKLFKEGISLPPITTQSEFSSILVTGTANIGGVGTELKKLLEWFGQYTDAGCSCMKHAAIMDTNGVRWCEDNVDTIVGWLAEEASKMKVLGFSMDKVPGFDWSARQVVHRAIVSAKKKPLIYVPPGNDGPLKAINGTTSGKRNLAYHLWPKKGPNLEIAVNQLKRRLDIFNGVRSIGVAVDGETESLDTVKEMFKDHRIDHWFQFDNNPKRRECVSFVPLLETMPRDNSVTFWGHGKSVRHHEGSICVDWAETQWQLLLDDMLSIDEALLHFPVVGCFKRSLFHFGPNCRYGWHYSGGAYWFRNEDVFKMQEWRRLPANWFGGTESWPGDMFPWENAGCIGPSGVGDLYKPDIWAGIKPDLDKVFEARKIIETNPESDESFFEQSARKGYTTWHWDALIETHTRGANVLKGMGCKTVLELGSGLGMFLVGATCIGLDVHGVDRNRIEREFAISKGVPPDRYKVEHLQNCIIENVVDAIYCIEVFEHIPDKNLKPICEQLARHCKWFYFTSTPHKDRDDEKWGHINLKSKEEWKDFFRGFGLEFERDDSAVCDWGMIFKGKVQ